MEHLKAYEAMNVRLIITLLADDYGFYEIPYETWLRHTNRAPASPAAREATEAIYSELSEEGKLPKVAAVRNEDMDFEILEPDLVHALLEMKTSPTSRIKRIHIPVEDGEFATEEQLLPAMRAARRAFEAGGCVYSHCWLGWGMLAKRIARLAFTHLHQL
jgi:hypothetical protein